MKKIDSTIIRETKYIALIVLIFSMLMQSVILIAGIWNITFVYGNILGFLAAVGNFFLMGLTVQKALTKGEEDAKKLIKLSQSLRLLMLLAVAVIAYLLGNVFNIFSVVIPFLFPRIAVMLRPIFEKRGEKR